jgi:hypothetical protein
MTSEPNPSTRIEWRPDEADDAALRARGLVPRGDVYPWLVTPGALPVRLTAEQAAEFERAGVPSDLPVVGRIDAEVTR